MKYTEFAVALTVILLAAGCATAFSAGPSSIKFKNVVDGMVLEKTIAMGGDDTDILRARIEAEGGISDWVSFEAVGNLTLDENNEFSMHPGPQRIKAVFSVPENTQRGAYTGRIMVTTWKPSSGGETVGIALKAAVPLGVYIDVTNNRLVSHNVLGLNMRQTHKANAPIGFGIKVFNDGNTEEPVTVKATIMDEDKTKVLSVIEDTMTPTMGVEETFDFVLTEAGLEDGIYQVGFEVVSESGRVWNEIKSIRVGTVQPKTPLPPPPETTIEAAATTISGEGGLKPATPLKKRVLPVITIIAVFLIVVAYYMHRQRQDGGENKVEFV